MNIVWKTVLVFACAFCSDACADVLYQETSLPHETQDAFVVRIAQKMYEHTRNKGYEVCGALRFDGVNYFIDIITSERNDECALPGDTQIYVHTHPINQGFHFSKDDYVRPGYLIAQNVIKFQNGGQVRTLAKRHGPQQTYTFTSFF